MPASRKQSVRKRTVGKADTASGIFLALAVVVSFIGLILFMSVDPAMRDTKRQMYVDDSQHTQNWPPTPAGRGNQPK